MKNFPIEMQLDENMVVEFAIPAGILMLMGLIVMPISG